MKGFHYSYQEGDEDYEAYFYKFQNEMTMPAEVPWLVPGILPQGGVTLLSGPPKEGKSDLVAAWAFAVASGTPFAGEPVEAGAVLWLDFEQTAREKILMLSAIPGASEGKAPDLPLVLAHALPGIDTADGRRAIGWALNECRPSLLVVDSLWAAVDESNVSRPRAARQALGMLGKICEAKGTTAVVIHHTEHTGKRPSASTQLQAACGVSLVQSMDVISGGRRLVHLRSRGRGVGIAGRTTLVSDGPGRYAKAGPEDLPLEGVLDAAGGSGPLLGATVLALFADGRELSAIEVSERMGMVYNTARLRLNSLVREGRLQVAGVRDRRRMYALRSGPASGALVPAVLSARETAGAQTLAFVRGAFAGGARLSVREAGERLGIDENRSRRWINRLVSRGELEVVEFGRGGRRYGLRGDEGEGG